MGMKREKWEKLRAKGKWNYILVYGVLLWGVGTAILFNLISVSIVGNVLPFLRIFAFSIVAFPVGGIAWGYLTWVLFENAYLKAKLSEQTHATEKRAADA